MSIVPKRNDHRADGYLKKAAESLVIMFDRCVEDPAVNARRRLAGFQSQCFREIQPGMNRSFDGLEFPMKLETGLAQGVGAG